MQPFKGFKDQGQGQGLTSLSLRPNSKPSSKIRS